MIWAVLDTNTLVSGLGWSGPPSEVIDLAMDGLFTILISRPLLDELADVIRRPRLAPQLHGLTKSRLADRGAERDSQALTAAIVTELTRSQGLSLRDVAEMFGLSHQRVQQIVQSANRAIELSPPARDRIDKLKAALRESSRGSPSQRH